MGSAAARGDLLSVASRLVALTNILVNPELKPWLSESGKDQSTVDMSVLKAAARAPLAQPEYANDLAFDFEAFKSILLEEIRIARRGLGTTLRGLFLRMRRWNGRCRISSSTGEAARENRKVVYVIGFRRGKRIDDGRKLWAFGKIA